MTENALMLKILREVRDELKGNGAQLKGHGEFLKAHGELLKAHGEQLKAIRAELVYMRRDGMKRDTHALEVDKRVEQTDGTIMRPGKRK